LQFNFILLVRSRKRVKDNVLIPVRYYSAAAKYFVAGNPDRDRVHERGSAIAPFGARLASSSSGHYFTLFLRGLTSVISRSIGKALPGSVLERDIGTGNIPGAERDTVGITEIELSEVSVRVPLAKC
jgi:hypothetical protein